MLNQVPKQQQQLPHQTCLGIEEMQLFSATLFSRFWPDWPTNNHTMFTGVHRKWRAGRQTPACWTAAKVTALSSRPNTPQVPLQF